MALIRRGLIFPTAKQVCQIKMKRNIRMPSYIQLCSIIGLCLLCTSNFAVAQDVYPQEKPVALEEKITVKEKKTNKDRIITLAIENDSLGAGTDENYTSGVRLTFMDVDANIPRSLEKIIEVIPTIKINDTTNVYYSVGHNIYTPEDITKVNLSENDRPYAGWLYGAAGFTTITDNRLDELEVAVGVVGQAALGEQIQKAVHKAVNSNDPKGWDTQIKNEPGLVLSWQRSWPSYKTYNALNYDVHLSPHIGTTLGNIYTFAHAGASIRVTPDNQRFQHNPVRVRPAIPGSGYYDLPDKTIGWYVFGGVDSRVMARNIFLDGNSFRDSPSIDKKNIVTDLNAGVAFTYDDIRISYSLNYRTKEYKAQDNDQVFGSLTVSKRF